ncbi:uncharacterized protein IL334_001012 [Kwoniella shivajii]|uniref:Uncharacterized protein n=1 Tax=Kwoniella shivajii TaxID=564305 RepID=A0ABZ1CSD2_9TREE|nr:hypothetical protein IL334_001012 [Kwoniella shivajii]
MKAPKRTPWSSRSELEELFEMLFSPSADVDSRRKGVARMSIYISSPSCPTFIHLLHSLVSVELLPYPPRGIEENQRLRMMIGMAVVRFINGLVDPLQNGPYARPISHLAASLSIPPSLIALRHQATHEDLPPLPLLHQALGQCIAYLHHYSFLPLLATSSSTLPPGVEERLRASEKRVESLTRRWKKVIKTRLREKEVREEDQSAIEMRKIQRDLTNEPTDVIVDVLVGQGGLVPLAITKRATFNANSPTTPSLKIWLPLLSYLTETAHPDLITRLSSNILDLLLNPSYDYSSGFKYNVGVSVDTEGQKEDKESFKWNLAVWLIWFWSTSNDSVNFILSEEDKSEFSRRIISVMIDFHDDIVIRRLFKAISSTSGSKLNGMDNLLPDPELEEDGLKGLEVDAEISGDDNLDQMENRLKQFEQLANSRKSAPTTKAISKNQISTLPDANTIDDEIPGWHRSTSQEWNPCPIGCSGRA